MKVLIISYYWPPSGGSGVQRWMYFSKHLKEQGVTPIIITIDPKYAAYPSFDRELLKEVKDIDVYYTKGKSILNLYSILKTGKKNKEIPSGNFGKEKKSLFDKIAGFIRGNFFIPDARVGWNKYAFKIAEEILSKNNIDVIITTGPPHSSHLIGDKLKKKNNIKWIADFRDPWREVYYNHLFHRTKLAEQIDRKLELQVLNNCDLVLTVGPSMRDLLASKLNSNKNKVHFLYNGYEYDLFKQLTKIENNEFTMSYVGTLSQNYPYKTIIDSINESAKNKINNFTIEFTGKIEDQIVNEFRRIPTINTKINGRVSHDKAVQYMKNSDLLILLLPIFGNTKIMVTGKLMEYLATGNPILCIGDKNSDAAKIISTQHNCCFAGIDEKDKVFNFIHSVYSNYSENKSTKKLPIQFSSYEITKELISLLKGL